MRVLPDQLELGGRAYSAPTRDRNDVFGTRCRSTNRRPCSV